MLARTTLRTVIVGFTLLFAALTGKSAVNFHIPRQPAISALKLFVGQADVEVLFSSDNLQGVQSNPVRGFYEPAKAIELLFRGSGFMARETSPGNFVIIEAPVGSPSGAPPDPSESADTLKPMVVKTSPYHEARASLKVDVKIETGPRSLLLNFAPASFGALKLDEWSSVLTPGRIMQRAKNSVFSVDVINDTETRRAPGFAVDQAIRRHSPDVNFAFRGDSLSSPGFLQNARFRDTGPFGGGAVVVLDGAPMGDPWSNRPRWAEAPRQAPLLWYVIFAGPLAVDSKSVLGAALFGTRTKPWIFESTVRMDSDAPHSKNAFRTLDITEC